MLPCGLQVNATRVADYIAEQAAAAAGAEGSGSARAQFLVVSHKPQVYERAGCLVGVYLRRGGSHAVTLHVEAAAASAGAARARARRTPSS